MLSDLDKSVIALGGYETALPFFIESVAGNLRAALLRLLFRLSAENAPAEDLTVHIIVHATSHNKS